MRCRWRNLNSFSFRVTLPGGVDFGFSLGSGALTPLNDFELICGAPLQHYYPPTVNWAIIERTARDPQISCRIFNPEGYADPPDFTKGFGQWDEAEPYNKDLWAVGEYAVPWGAFVGRIDTSCGTTSSIWAKQYIYSVKFIDPSGDGTPCVAFTGATANQMLCYDNLGRPHGAGSFSFEYT